MRSAIEQLPAELVCSITWDQGTEMARHKEFTVATGVPVYFCDPHSLPGNGGRTTTPSGCFGQYMPKGSDLSVHSAEDLARFAASLNNRRDARIDDTISGIRQRRCVDRLRTHPFRDRAKMSLPTRGRPSRVRLITKIGAIPAQILANELLLKLRLPAGPTTTS